MNIIRKYDETLKKKNSGSKSVSLGGPDHGQKERLSESAIEQKHQELIPFGGHGVGGDKEWIPG